MATKPIEKTRPAPPTAEDDLRAAYEIHTLAGLLYRAWSGASSWPSPPTGPVAWPVAPYGSAPWTTPPAPPTPVATALGTTPGLPPGMTHPMAARPGPARVGGMPPTV